MKAYFQKRNRYTSLTGFNEIELYATIAITAMAHDVITANRYRLSGRCDAIASKNNVAPAIVIGNTAACEQKSNRVGIKAKVYAPRLVSVKVQSLMAMMITSNVMATSDEYCFKLDEKKTRGIAMENIKVATIDATGRRIARATKKNKMTLAIPAAIGVRRNAYSEGPSSIVDNFMLNKKPGGATWA
ncbi:MAG: hypothetical protein CVU44_15525 [Chloroflexi bacterium HGW-Chloroflexi-6]|nr:MAG: hypothetical protein CVU44_15525 [Chloroflexi bacterium HGW-Chloroflexi-6]